MYFSDFLPVQPLGETPLRIGQGKFGLLPCPGKSPWIGFDKAWTWFPVVSLGSGDLVYGGQPVSGVIVIAPLRRAHAGVGPGSSHGKVLPVALEPVPQEVRRAFEFQCFRQVVQHGPAALWPGPRFQHLPSSPLAFLQEKVVWRRTGPESHHRHLGCEARGRWVGKPSFNRRLKKHFVCFYMTFPRSASSNFHLKLLGLIMRLEGRSKSGLTLSG